MNMPQAAKLVLVACAVPTLMTRFRVPESCTTCCSLARDWPMAVMLYGAWNVSCITKFAHVEPTHRGGLAQEVPPPVDAPLRIDTAVQLGIPSVVPTVPACVCTT